MERRELTIEEQVYITRLQQEIDRSLGLEVQLNKVLNENSKLKKEIEEIKEDNARLEESQS